jgi:para-aminobenzoate synthetase component 1
MIWSHLLSKILMDFLFQIYSFFNLKTFFIRENDVEMQYLALCDDELEDDFEEILSQVLHHDIKSNPLK